MKIIMMMGKHQSGKTQIINDIFDTIKGPNDKKIQLKNSNDFEAKIVYNGKSVGFYSRGDDKSDITDAIDKYSQQNCDILICANSFVRSLWRNKWLYNLLQTKYNIHHIIQFHVPFPALLDIIQEIK